MHWNLFILVGIKIGISRQLLNTNYHCILSLLLQNRLGIDDLGNRKGTFSQLKILLMWPIWKEPWVAKKVEEEAAVLEGDVYVKQNNCSAHIWALLQTMAQLRIIAV